MEAVGGGRVSPQVGIIEQLCEGLVYQDDQGQWVELPSWAKFFMRLGAHIARWKRGNSRPIVALALPTRAYASALSAAGIVASRARDSLGEDPTEHIAMLRAQLRLASSGGLDNGHVTVVSRSDARHYTVGWLRRISTFGSEEYLDVQVGKDGFVRVPLRKAGRVELAAKQLTHLPGGIKVKTVRGSAGIMEGVLTADEAGQFIGQARTDCVIVGSRSRLSAEILGTKLRCQSSAGRITNGSMDDIVRLRLARSGTTCYRTEITSVDQPIRRPRAAEQCVAIFDGSNAFLKWQSVWNDLPLIVMLDRTDPTFNDAKTEIDRLFLARLDDLPIDR